MEKRVILEVEQAVLAVLLLLLLVWINIESNKEGKGQSEAIKTLVLKFEWLLVFSLNNTWKSLTGGVMKVLIVFCDVLVSYFVGVDFGCPAPIKMKEVPFWCLMENKNNLSDLLKKPGFLNNSHIFLKQVRTVFVCLTEWKYCSTLKKYNKRVL